MMFNFFSIKVLLPIKKKIIMFIQILLNLFQFLNFLCSKLKTIINGKYHKNLVVESLSLAIYIILLYFIKYITMIVVIK